jgi:hypothetical protein
MKLEDVNDLQATVAENAESIEAGLKIIDSGVSLGGATIDLVAVDSGTSLTLVALGFVADDEMLMRALEAYSWCQEDPEGLRRLYPMARLSSGQPPRVIFVAEQLPEAFLRKARHLRFHRVDFVQFKFGLQFTPVGVPRKGEEPRPAEPARQLPATPRRPSARAVAEKLRVADGRRVEPRAAEPRVAEPRAPEPRAAEARVPEPRVAEPRHHLEVPRAVEVPHVFQTRTPQPAGMRDPSLREGLKAPVNGATSPQWQRELERRPGDVDEWKVKVVREYLQREFPTSVIYDFFAQDLCVQMFHLQDNLGAVVHTAAVAEDLLVDLSESEISAFFDKHKFARVLRQAGQAAVSVTKAGLKIEAS